MADIGKHLPCLYKNGYAVEIHHKLFDTTTTDGKDYNDLIDNATEILIGNTKARILPKEIQLKHLINHYERHALEGYCQLRLYADIILLDKASTIGIPDSFIYNPRQETKMKYRKAAYKINIHSIQAKYRLQYIIGDIFPSVKWMKERYNCTGLKTLVYYPIRVGKLLWLVNI